MVDFTLTCLVTPEGGYSSEYSITSWNRNIPSIIHLTLHTYMTENSKPMKYVSQCSMYIVTELFTDMPMKWLSHFFPYLE